MSIRMAPMSATSISTSAPWRTSAPAPANSTRSARWRGSVLRSKRAMVRTGVPPHVQAFVAHTMTLAQSGSTEEVLAAFFYGREDIIPEMFSRLQKTLPGARHDNDPLRHFIYYIERHIELDGDSHGPMGRELLEGLVADSPQKARTGSARRVQQHQGPDRPLEWHIKHTSRDARGVKAKPET